MSKEITEVKPVNKSTAKTVIEPQKSDTLLSFSLPDVTTRADDFIADEKPMVEGTQSDNALEMESPPEYDNEADKVRGTPDSKGTPYDPLIHAFPPEMTGKLKKWKRKPKSQVDKSINDDVKSNSSYRSEADKFAKLYGQGHMLLFGADGKINDVADLVPLTDDLERYFMENGHTQISPAWSVALSSLLYSVGVAQREPNMAKVKRWTSGAWLKIKGLFGKGKKKKVVSGDDLDQHRTKAESSKPVQQAPKNSEQSKYPEAGGSF